MKRESQGMAEDFAGSAASDALRWRTSRFSIAAHLLLLLGATAGVFLAGMWEEGNIAAFLTIAGIASLVCPPRIQVDWKIWAAAVALLPLLTPVTWGHHLVVDLIPLYVLAWLAIRRRHVWLGLLALLAWVLANPVHLVFMAAYLSGVKTPVVMDAWVELPVLGVILIWALCLYAYRPTANNAPAVSKSAIRA